MTHKHLPNQLEPISSSLSLWVELPLAWDLRTGAGEDLDSEVGYSLTSGYCIPPNVKEHVCSFGLKIRNSPLVFSIMSHFN